MYAEIHSRDLAISPGDVKKTDISDILYGSDTGNVIDHGLFSITQAQLATLRPGIPPSYSVVDGYLALLSTESLLPLSSSFSTFLRKRSLVDLIRWPQLRRGDAFRKTTVIIFSIHESSSHHWALAAILPRQCEVHIFDSNPTEQTFDPLYPRISSLTSLLLTANGPENGVRRAPFKVISRTLEGQEQENGIDAAVYVCANALNISVRRPEKGVYAAKCGLIKNQIHQSLLKGKVLKQSTGPDDATRSTGQAGSHADSNRVIKQTTPKPSSNMSTPRVPSTFVVAATIRPSTAMRSVNASRGVVPIRPQTAAASAAATTNRNVAKNISSAHRSAISHEQMFLQPPVDLDATFSGSSVNHDTTGDLSSNEQPQAVSVDIGGIQSTSTSM